MKNNKKKLYGSFLWMGFNILKTIEPLLEVQFLPLSLQAFS